MKIEKVNDHQIRCTLTREDLASRRLKMSELAYGSDKAKDLFRDMMEKANDEYGFEADNIPLMIEAIPMSGECIVLVITKVEDPEELDTRFSKFAPDIEGCEDCDDSEDESLNSSPDDIVNISDLFKKFKSAVSSAKENGSSGIGSSATEGFEGMAFGFKSVTEVMDVCKKACKDFIGDSSLYKNSKTNEYLLTLTRRSMDVTDFVKICNIFSEYGAPLRGSTISESFLKEHFEPIVEKDAVLVLSEF